MIILIKLGTLLLRFISLILGIEENESFPPPLSKDEESRLFSEMQNGSEEARNRIIEHNLRLVSHIIKKYYSLILHFISPQLVFNNI